MDALLSEQMLHFEGNAQLTYLARIREQQLLTMDPARTRVFYAIPHVPALDWTSPWLRIFLLSEQQEFVYRNFQRIADARSFVNNLAQISNLCEKVFLIGLPCGSGKRSYVTIRKHLRSSFNPHRDRARLAGVRRFLPQPSNSSFQSRTRNQNLVHTASHQQLQGDTRVVGRVPPQTQVQTERARLALLGLPVAGAPVQSPPANRLPRSNSNGAGASRSPIVVIDLDGSDSENAPQQTPVTVAQNSTETRNRVVAQRVDITSTDKPVEIDENIAMVGFSKK